jgi:hypothetical protein
MENSRQSSMAQLSAWTDVMRKNKAVEMKKQAVEADDYYEEEFEDYDEDFEVDESPVKSMPKQAAAPISMQSESKVPA